MAIVQFSFSSHQSSNDNLNTNTFMSEFEPLVMLGGVSTFNFFKVKSDSYYNINIQTTNTSYLVALFQKTMLDRLSFVVDTTHISAANTNVLYVFNCFYTNRFTNVLYTLSTDCITSISKVFPGAGWIERELKEFSSVRLVGLLDSRRLLTDYTGQRARESQVHYDLLNREIF